MSTSAETGARPDRSLADDGVRQAIREARTQAAVAVAFAGALLVALAVVDSLEDWSLLGAPWWIWLIFAIPEVLLLGGLLFSGRGGVSPGRRHGVIVALLSFLALTSLAATGLLVAALVGSSTNDLSAGNLLVHALTVWLTNMIVFSLLFWELDAGGPVQRATVGRAVPDFQFPQDQSPELAPPGWRTALFDYFYVSLTNSMAFSPTDAMPLSRQAKGLMSVESVLSNIIVVLVIARAVNVLGSP
jgi:uncharacterized membrane protein